MAEEATDRPDQIARPIGNAQDNLFNNMSSSKGQAIA